MSGLSTFFVSTAGNKYLRLPEFLHRVSLDALAAPFVLVLQQLKPGLHGRRGHGQRPNNKAMVRFLIPLTLQHFLLKSPEPCTS